MLMLLLAKRPRQWVAASLFSFPLGLLVAESAKKNAKAGYVEREMQRRSVTSPLATVLAMSRAAMCHADLHAAAMHCKSLNRSTAADMK
jgi:hypothetical protein